jgi:hypothetical protein
MKRALLFAIFWSTGLHALAADPVPFPPRLAVISDAGSKDIASSLTAELSANSALILVERDSFAKIGDEAKVQQMAGADATSLGELLGADGLLFIDRRTDGLHARLTAVKLGYALFDNSVPVEVNSQMEAKALAHLVGNDAPKLKLDPTHAIAISVLNLRADSTTATSSKLERDLTLLLESRLAAMPDYVILERRHAWSLQFDHSLVAPDQAVLKGAFLVDGSFKSQGMASDIITIDLRIRSSKEQQQTTISAEGSSKNLPGLVEKILLQIRDFVGAGSHAIAGDSLAEAREYLQEGIWAWHANQPGLALEALDSADLLGETAPDLLAARIITLCKLGGDVDLSGGSQTGVDWMDRHFGKGNNTLPAEPRPEDRTELLLRAMDDWRVYAATKGESRLTLLTNIYSPNGTIRILYGGTDELQTKILYASSKVLAMLDVLQDTREESFRQALRDFAGFDPLHGQMPSGGVFALDYADEWSEFEGEELAYLHNLCANFIPDYDLRYKLEQTLFSTGAINFCPRFATTLDSQKALFQKFIAGLVGDPATKPVGLAAAATWDDSIQRAADFHLLLDNLWNDRDSLFKSSRLEGLVERAVVLQDKISSPADPKLVALFRYSLWNHNPGVIGGIMWHPDLFPLADAPSLWNDLEALKARAQATVNTMPKNTNMAPVFQAALQGGYAKLEAAYIAKWGNPDKMTAAASGTDSGPLIVNRYWCSWRTEGAPPISLEKTFPVVGTDKTLWVYGYDLPPQNGIAAVDGYMAVPADLFQIHLPDLKTISSLNPRQIASGGLRSPVLAVGTDAVYIASVTNYQPEKCMLDRFQISTRKWEAREISLMISQIFPVGNKIYFTFQGESGLARYDWDSGQTIVLASSRRRPAQNQFDDRAPYEVAKVFAGPEGKPCTQIERVNYFIQETPGEWAQQGNAGMFQGIPQDPKVGFFPDPFGFHSSTVEPEFQPMSKSSTWYLACREKIDAQRKGDPIGYAFRNGDFFVMGHTNDSYVLWWCKPGEVDPVPIPLKLVIDDATQVEIKSHYGDARASVLISPTKSPTSDMSMTVTSEGLGMVGEEGGFWFLPFSDIDAYLMSHPENKPISQSPVTSGPDGDTDFDPRNPTSFR